MSDLIHLAVRATDLFSRNCTADSIPIGEVLVGSPFTYVEELPQSYITNVVLPYGQIMSGSAFTYVDDMPAARWIDYFTCKLVQITSAIFTYIA